MSEHSNETTVIAHLVEAHCIQQLSDKCTTFSYPCSNKVRSEGEARRMEGDGGHDTEPRGFCAHRWSRGRAKEQSKHSVRASACASCNQTSPPPAFGLQHTTWRRSQGRGRTRRKQASRSTRRKQGFGSTRRRTGWGRR